MRRAENTILLVEDNEDDVELTLLELQKLQGVTVDVVRDGAAALEYIFSDNGRVGAEVNTLSLPDLVILDINLPKLSGLEVLRHIRADARTKLLPTVMLTTSRHDHDLLESYAGGANSFVRKPVSFEEFAEAVKQLGVYWLNLNEVPRTRL